MKVFVQSIFQSLICFLPFWLNAQNGIISGDTLKLNDGLIFIKGNSVIIGKGSKADGGYAYISTAPEINKKIVIMPVQLSAGWQGYKMKIVSFKLSGTEISGKRYYLVLTIFEKDKLYYWCDPSLAKNAGELEYSFPQPF